MYFCGSFNSGKKKNLPIQIILLMIEYLAGRQRLPTAAINFWRYFLMVLIILDR
jgi:hypothetical protein